MTSSRKYHWPRWSVMRSKALACALLAAVIGSELAACAGPARQAGPATADGATNTTGNQTGSPAGTLRPRQPGLRRPPRRPSRPGCRRQHLFCAGVEQHQPGRAQQAQTPGAAPAGRQAPGRHADRARQRQRQRLVQSGGGRQSHRGSRHHPEKTGYRRTPDPALGAR